MFFLFIHSSLCFSLNELCITWDAKEIQARAHEIRYTIGRADKPTSAHHTNQRFRQSIIFRTVLNQRMTWTNLKKTVFSVAVEFFYFSLYILSFDWLSWTILGRVFFRKSLPCSIHMRHCIVIRKTKKNVDQQLNVLIHISRPYFLQSSASCEQRYTKKLIIRTCQLCS